MKESIVCKVLDVLEECGVVVINAQGEIIFINSCAEKLLDLPKENLEGQSLWEIHRFCQRDPGLISQAFEKAREEGIYRFTFCYPRGEEKRLFEAFLRPLTHEGDHQGFVLTFKDVTSVHRHRQELQEKEDLFKVLARGARLLIEKECDEAVNSFLKMFQETARLAQILFLEIKAGRYQLCSAVPGLPASLSALPREILPPKGRPYFCTIQEWPEDYQCLWKEREVRSFFVQPVLVEEHLRGLLLAGAREEKDLGRKAEALSLAAELIGAAIHRKHLEEQFFQAQKMESLAQLAGGMAHNFNNLLTIILGNVERFRRNPGPQSQRYLKEIENCALRGAELIRQLMVFSANTVFNAKPCSLNEILSDIQDMVRIIASEKIKIVLKREASWEAKADPSLVEQILLNLVTNARDAMPSGGELRIRTANVRLEEEEAVTLGLSPGPYVLLEVADTGQGMSEEVRWHIFEAFFTTKEPGKGTGLGLAMVYGAMRRLGGGIQVETTEGKGSVFRLYFPAIRKEEEIKKGLMPTDTPLQDRKEAV